MDPPKLLSYYTDKINIYKSDCFIPLPNYRTCPPPSMCYSYPTALLPNECVIPSIPVPLPVAKRPPFSFGQPTSGGCKSCGPCGGK